MSAASTSGVSGRPSAVAARDGEALGIAPQVHAHVACDQQEVAYLEEPSRLERRARGRRLRQRGSEARDVGGRHRACLGGERDQLGEGVEALLDQPAIGDRPERACRLPPRLGACQRGDGRQHARQLEGLEIAGSHRRRSYSLPRVGGTATGEGSAAVMASRIADESIVPARFRR